MSVDPVSIGIKVGLTALSMGLQMMNKTEGPRLDTLDVSLADFGTPGRYFWGIVKLQGCPIIWAEKLREEKVETKGKGGKYENYKYYGTWGNLIAMHRIDAIRRVWMDNHLVYQVKDIGPIAPVLSLGSDDGTLMGKIGIYNHRIYLGTEDQEPDPRMEAWCEDRYGPDSCPAYRGCALAVWQNLPLEKFGNRIPQVTIEAANGSVTAHPYETIAGKPPGAPRLWGFTYSPDFTKFVCGQGSSYQVWDVPTRTRLVAGTIDDGGDFTANRVGLYNNGTMALTGGNSLVIYGPDGFGATLDADYYAVSQSECWVMRDGDGQQFLCSVPYSYQQTFYINATPIEPAAISGDSGWTPGAFLTDAYGDVWAVGRRIGPFVDADKLYLYRVATAGQRPEIDSLHIINMPASGSAVAVAGAHGEGHFLIMWGADLYLIDDESFGIVMSLPGVVDVYNTPKQLANHPCGAPTIWLNTTEYSLADLSVVRTVNVLDWKDEDADGIIYDRINHALLCFPQFADVVTWRYLDRVGSDGVTLQTIVEDVAGWCGVDVDAASLDQIVYGYSVVQGAGKDMIAPLLDVHDVDCRPHDFTVQFVKRGGGSSGTVATEWFVREGAESRYAVKVQQDTDLPRRLAINFADRDKDQQTNTVISQRPLDSVDGVREQTIDLTTYVTTPAEAQQLSDRRFRRLWNERESIDNAVTLQMLALEPADIWTLSLDGVERNGRLDKLTVAQRRLTCTWKRDALTLAGLNSSQGANMDGRDEETIYIPGPAKGIVVETPYLSDSEANQAPLIHYAAGTYGEQFNFPGAIIEKTDYDGNEFSEWNVVESVSRATWGYVTGTLNDCDPWCWDRGSSLSIDTFGRTLVSTTEAAINADPAINQAVIGNEVVNFVTATLEVDGTYTVSGFKRGRRGTDWAVSGHAPGELFVLASSLQVDGYGLSDVGRTETFRTQMLGRDPATGNTQTIALSAATLKPYAPARLKWSYDGTDLQGAITRRTRVGSSFLAKTTTALSETSEAYEVDIFNGATFKRTIMVNGTNTFTYTAAMASADGISLPTLPTARVYQMSSDVGRGYALAA